MGNIREQKQVKLSAVTAAEMRQMLKRVAREWQAAVNCFNEATEKAAIDAAIMSMTAAEKKYADIIMQARQIGLSLPVTIDGYEERRKLLCLN